MKLTAKQLRYLWISMFLLQEAWLVATWLAGASANPRKLIVVSVYSLICLLGVLFLSERAIAKIRSLYHWLDGRHTDFLLLLGLVLFVVSIIYINGQRKWSDELNNYYFSRHLTLNGLSYIWQNYAKDMWIRQHPPLIFLLNGLSMVIFGVGLRVIRWVTVCFSLGTLAVTYLLGRTLYNRAIGIIAAIFLMTFPLFIRVGTAGMLDVQVAFFFSLAVLLAVLMVRKPSYKLAVALGLTLGLGMLTKYLMMIIIVLLMLLVLAALVRHDKTAPDRIARIKQILPPFLVAALISGAIFMSWAWYAGKIGVQTPLTGTFQLFTPTPTHTDPVDPPSVKSEVDGDYMDFSLGFFLFSATGLKFTLNVLLTRLPSSIGLYNFPLILFGLILLLKRRSKADLLLLAWITIVVALLLLTVPDHRYFMPAFPALTILIACWLEMNPQSIERTTILALLFQVGALYIFIDWNRLNQLF
jgi:4-amino-4-deoxy-L-arabinose transferase-like glycosyltransferase